MRFWLALFVSLLAHGLFYAWLLQQQPKPTRAAAAKPAPLQVVLIRTPNRQQAAKAPKAATPSAVATPIAASTTSAQPSATRTKVARSQSRDQKSKATVTAKTTTAAAKSTAVAAIPTADLTSILEQARNRAQQRPLSSAELQALTENTIGHPDPQMPKEPQQQNPAHLAKDVLIAFDNGNQLVKVGKDRCVLVSQGADLQKDIQGMKIAPCTKDKNAAMFERIMSKIGQNRTAGDN